MIKPCIGFLSIQVSWIPFLHPTRNSLSIPLQNVQTMILYPNPDFTKAIETYGADYLPADHPNQYIGYLYNSQTEEMLPFSPADLGYEENMHMVLVPREEIVPLDDIGNEK